VHNLLALRIFGAMLIALELAGKEKNNYKSDLAMVQKAGKVATWRTLWGTKNKTPTPRAWKIFAIFHQLKTDSDQFSMPYATRS